MLLPKSDSPRLTTKRGQKGTGDQPTMCPHGTSFTLFHPQSSPHRGVGGHTDTPCPPLCRAVCYLLG